MELSFERFNLRWMCCWNNDVFVYFLLYASFSLFSFFAINKSLSLEIVVAVMLFSLQ